jgi:hypothetical protein
MFKGPVSFNLFSHDLFLRQSNTSSVNTDYLKTSPSPLKSKSILLKEFSNNPEEIIMSYFGQKNHWEFIFNEVGDRTATLLESLLFDVSKWEQALRNNSKGTDAFSIWLKKGSQQ